VIIVFKGEKTTTFWIGLIVFGYSIVQFCQAIWQTIYYYFIYPSVISLDPTIHIYMLGTAVPLVIGGIIFLIIGLYIMKAGVRKEPTLTQS
jgi:hypothetical protein